MKNKLRTVYEMLLIISTAVASNSYAMSNDSFQGKLDYDYKSITNAKNSSGLSYQYYFSPVSTRNVPYGSAPFVGRKSSLDVYHNEVSASSSRQSGINGVFISQKGLLVKGGYGSQYHFGMNENQNYNSYSGELGHYIATNSLVAVGLSRDNLPDTNNTYYIRTRNFVGFDGGKGLDLIAKYSLELNSNLHT